jgi:chromosome segregation ATPase
MDWTTIITAAIVPAVLGLAGLIVGLRKARPDAAATLTGAALKMVENAQEESNEAKVEARAIRTEMQLIMLDFHKIQRQLTEATKRISELERDLSEALEVVQILQSRISELETENAELKRRLGLQENK